MRHRTERSLQRQVLEFLEPLPAKDGGAYAASVDARESRLATMALAEQNATLRTDVTELETQVRGLTEALAAARAESDVFRVRADRGDLDRSGTAADADVLMREEIRIVDVNPALRMVVLNAGAAKGMKPGMAFTVLRGEQVVAGLRVVDVREHVSGAVMEKVKRGRWPEKGDRIVPRRTTDV